MQPPPHGNCCHKRRGIKPWQIRLATLHDLYRTLNITPSPHCGKIRRAIMARPIFHHADPNPCGGFRLKSLMFITDILGKKLCGRQNAGWAESEKQLWDCWAHAHWWRDSFSLKGTCRTYRRLSPKNCSHHFQITSSTSKPICPLVRRSKYFTKTAA